LEFRLPLQFRSGARNQFEGHSVKVERNLVAGNAFLIGTRVWFEKMGVAIQPGEPGGANRDPAKFGLTLEELKEVEF
jgi:hypothetical protein